MDWNELRKRKSCEESFTSSVWRARRSALREAWFIHHLITE
jgi:hypothetical protein